MMVKQGVIANLKPCHTYSTEQQLAEVVVPDADEQLLQKLAIYIFLILEVAQGAVGRPCNSACGKQDKSMLNGTAPKTDRTLCLVQMIQLLQIHSPG